MRVCPVCRTQGWDIKQNGTTGVVREDGQLEPRYECPCGYSGPRSDFHQLEGFKDAE